MHMHKHIQHGTLRNAWHWYGQHVFSHFLGGSSDIEETHPSNVVFLFVFCGPDGIALRGALEAGGP